MDHVWAVLRSSVGAEYGEVIPERAQSLFLHLPNWKTCNLASVTHAGIVRRWWLGFKLETEPAPGPGGTLVPLGTAVAEKLFGAFLWLEWVKRCPNPMPGPSEIEIRPLFEEADFEALLAEVAARDEAARRDTRREC